MLQDPQSLSQKKEGSAFGIFVPDKASSSNNNTHSVFAKEA
jgi:hypothetical protein